MDKSPEAFRTISEVAEALATPAHVLRFWESRFPQIRPVKRAGGRRYYRPADVALLSGIRHLLHDEGLTIRGVQKILREQGVRHVAALGDGGLVGDLDAEGLDGAAFAAEGDAFADMGRLNADGEPPSAQVYDLTPVARLPVIAARDAAGIAEAPSATNAGEVVPLYAQPADAVPFGAGGAESAESAGDSLTDELLQTPLMSEDGGELADVTPDLPPAAVPEPPAEVPEAGFVWVESEPEPDLSQTAPTRLFAAARPAEAPVAEVAAPVPLADGDRAPVAAPAAPEPRTPGLAARLRALPRPLSPEALPELEDLRNRLGLLQSQMIEAMRHRR